MITVEQPLLETVERLLGGPTFANVPMEEDEAPLAVPLSRRRNTSEARRHLVCVARRAGSATGSRQWGARSAPLINILLHLHRATRSERQTRSFAEDHLQRRGARLRELAPQSDSCWKISPKPMGAIEAGRHGQEQILIDEIAPPSERQSVRGVRGPHFDESILYKDVGAVEGVERARAKISSRVEFVEGDPPAQPLRPTRLPQNPVHAARSTESVLHSVKAL